MTEGGDGMIESGIAAFVGRHYLRFSTSLKREIVYNSEIVYNNSNEYFAIILSVVKDLFRE